MSILDDIAEKIGALLSDEESMQQLRELAAMFSDGEISDGGENASSDGEDNSGSPGIDPMMIMQLMGAVSASDKNIDLLKALRPHLSEGRQQKLDRAMKLLKLYNIFTVLRESGMLNDLEKML